MLNESRRKRACVRATPGKTACDNFWFRMPAAHNSSSVCFNLAYLTTAGVRFQLFSLELALLSGRRPRAQAFWITPFGSRFERMFCY